MSQELVYQWEAEIGKHLAQLNRWTVRALAELSYGVMVAESCQSRKVARQLSRGKVKIESVERRWQRFLANAAITPEYYFGAWTEWIVRAVEVGQVYLLVDETKLGDKIGAMVVGLAYRQRCIPLAWRIYRANSTLDYPPEGQVGLIRTLLAAIQVGIPSEVKVVVLADRGIGNSAALCQVVSDLGWYYLFRVTCQTTMLLASGAKVAIAAQANPGTDWQAEGRIFTKKARLPARGIALQTLEAAEPWALVTNHPDLTGWEYAFRNWQEQAFRDLKSHGWHWQASRVSDPRHVSRLWLILVVAYARVLAWGVARLAAGEGMRPRRVQNTPTRSRLSLFQEGLEALQLLLTLASPPALPFLFPPP